MSEFLIHRARLVGDDLSLVPYQSAFGCAARLARLNQIRVPAEFNELLGIKPSASQTMLRMLSVSRPQQEALADALGIARPAEWDPSLWYPFQNKIPGEAIYSRLRYCLACIRLGFHSLLHQLPWTPGCPWHGTVLKVGCPRCGKEPCTTARGGSRLLTCVCGYDLVNESACARQRGAAQAAAELQSAYLDWCAHERETKHLIYVSGAPLDLEKLARLVVIPSGLGIPSNGSRKPARPYRSNGASAATRVPPGIENLAFGRAVAVNEVEFPVFKHIAANVAAHPGSAKLSPLDHSRLGLPELPDGRERSGVTPAGESWRRVLQPELLHHTHRSFLLRLVEVHDQLYAPACPAGPEAAEALHRAQAALLYRAYAEGMMVAVLGRQNQALPARYRQPFPVALLNMGAEAEIRLLP